MIDPASVYEAESNKERYYMNLSFRSTGVHTHTHTPYKYTLNNKTEKQNPARDAHAPERAVNGYHAAQLDGNFLCLNDQRAAKQRGV